MRWASLVLLVISFATWNAAARAQLRESTTLLLKAPVALPTATPTPPAPTAPASAPSPTPPETDRSAGTPGAQQAADAIAQSFSELIARDHPRAGTPAAKLFRQAFLLTVPVVEVCRVRQIPSAIGTPASATATAPGTDRSPAAAAEPLLPIFPLSPSGGQGASLGAPGKPALLPVLYGGDGSLASFKGKDLAGRVVVLEINEDHNGIVGSGGKGGGSTAWQRAASLGAAAILFLGNEQTDNSAFLRRYTSLPQGVPRLYCDDAQTAQRLRSGEIQALSMEVRVGWHERRVENVIGILPAKNPEAGPPAGADQWVVLQARYDGASQVMDRAPGATQAMNAAALLKLAAAIQDARRHCGVVCVWTGGDEWDNRGSREFLDLLQRGAGGSGGAAGGSSVYAMLLQRRVVDAEQQFQVSQEILAGVEHVATEGWTPRRGKTLTPAARAAIEEELLRQSARVESELQDARLAAARTQDSPGTAGPADSLDSLKQRKQQLMVAGSIAAGRYEPTTGEESERALVAAAAREVAGRWRTDVERRSAEVDALRNWPQIREAMPAHDPFLWISLALTGGAPGPAKLGLTARSGYSTGLDVTGRMVGYGQAFRRYAATLVQAGLASVYLPEALETGTTLETFFPAGDGGSVGFSSDAAIARGQPALAAATLLDRAPQLDTPNDRPQAIAWDKVDQEERTLEILLLGLGPSPGALTDPRLYVRTDLPVLASDQPVTLYERAPGETLPRLKAAGALLGGESEIYRHPLGPPLAGTRRQDWYLTHADGTATFHSANRVLEAEVRMQAFTFDARGKIRQALLANAEEVRGMVADFFPVADRPIRAMLFDARALDCFGLFDPRYLDELDQVQLLDARRQDTVQMANVYARDGIAVAFLPGGGGSADQAAWQLLASRGNVNNRMIVINADAAHPGGVGFATVDRAAIGPLEWRSARDFYFLDSQRKLNLEKFGISNEVIRDLQAASDRQFAAGESAEAQRDYPAFFSAAHALWSLQSQEYQNLIETSNGIIKGVIFLLLGVIPFSYFLERLLIGSPHVYRQIAWFAGIFCLMTAGLWFHPAFRISSAPMMILLAFLILILSSTVVYILWGKFEDEIARMRGTAASAGHVQSFRRGAVVSAAIRLGLSNMRRRGMRTALTLLTLILLTFTLLCFTSVRESVQVSPRPVAWPAGAPLPRAGILLRQREWRELPPQTLQLAHELALPAPVMLAQAAAVARMESPPDGPVARRYWYASEQNVQSWKLPVLALGAGAPVQPYYLSGLVGLDSTEAEFQGAAIGQVLPGFSQVDETDAPRCWLPVQARDSLHLSPGQKVHLAGYDMTVSGFFDAPAFASLRQLSGDPVAPTDPSSMQRTSTGGGGRSEESLQPEGTYHFLNPVSVAIVPAWVTQRMGARLTSVMIRPAGIAARPADQDASLLLAAANALARRSAFAVYASDGRQVQVINAAEASRPQDLGTVLVPMLIAGVIVLNTMLGAVSERTREIHVYTSVGLSPAHVGMLFLAEAAALGTLGVVFGYIFGQGLATILSWTRLLPGVDLNYSSMSAIVTMGLVLGLVMLSALWPARAATRLATPSLQRDWKLPRPVGDLLAVDLPFTVNEMAARGVCAFLAEYLQSTSQAGTGRFTADNIHGFVQPTTFGPGAEVRGLVARIWLSPYDLGVIQTMQLAIHPTDQPGVFDVHVDLTREAGNPATWRRLNRPFLVEIRKQFLLWRAVDAGRMADYVAKSQTLFEAPADPSRGPS